MTMSISIFGIVS